MSVLTRTYKNLLMGNRRNGLVSVSKCAQKRPLAVTHELNKCVYTLVHGSVHVHM